MKKASFFTLGCRVNQYETQVMMNLFKENDYKISSFDEFCDVYIINSCTVTAMSDKKSRQALRRAKRLNPDSVCAIVGCYPQNADCAKELPEADIILGNGNKEKILEAVNNILNEKNKVIEIEASKKIKTYNEFSCTPLFDNKTRAMIKIQDGCDRFCSYCIIPYVRGPVRSRNFESIISEAKTLADCGFVEVVLTGIQTAAYGQDLEKGSLIEVIEKVAEIEGIKRIRLGSLEPVIITDDFINRAKNTGKLCHSFHLSLQSGCNSVLERMNRRYTVEKYKESIEIIRKYYPDAGITTDVIAGFPGETDEEFEKSLRFIESMNFSHIHAFPYSPREGTKAASMSNQIDKATKEERVKKLNLLSEKSHNKYLESLYGNTYPVLFETKKDDNSYIGFTPNYVSVCVKNTENLCDKILDVTINSENAE